MSKGDIDELIRVSIVTPRYEIAYAIITQSINPIPLLLNA
jgi:hypothetical protein